MKKLLVFFHPRGENKDFLKVFTANLAEKFDAEVFSFNAPFEYEGGYQWLDATDGVVSSIGKDQFEQSVMYSVDLINAEVNKRKMQFSDVIFAGNSQGGFMAVYMALRLGGKAVALCSAIPYELKEKFVLNYKNAPIDWVEGAKDNLLTQVRKDSYKILVDMGCNLRYILNEKSTHTGLDFSIIEQL